MSNIKKILIVEDEFIIADVLQNMLQEAGYEVCGIACTAEEALVLISQYNPNFVLLDIYLKGKMNGIDLAYKLTDRNIPFIYISANSNEKVLQAAKVTNPYGFVIKPFREKDVLTALDIAVYRHENHLEKGLRESAILQKQAAEILTSSADWEYKLLQMAKALQPFVPFEFFSSGPKMEVQDTFFELSFSRIGFDEYQVIGVPELVMVTNRKQEELANMKIKDQADLMATWYGESELMELFKKPSLKSILSNIYNLKSHLSVPLVLSNGKVWYFNFYSRRPDAYQADHLVICNRFQQLLTDFIDNLLRLPGSPILAQVMSPAIKQEQANTGQLNPFSDIIGSSHLLLNVFDQVLQVARAESSVLILGESGTGKEKIAERIHALSPRKSKPFIRINCAALPISLIDSELFGHEKGAFTGAHERKIGRFEQAQMGTLFLDEIGELSLESQSKLLRVLQEKEIERIGGRTTIKTDVRIIAATNRNLDKEVAEGRFRLDLFYRINVFPIVMPPLRERKEDIPDLAAHFLKIYARKIGKPINGISAQVLENMKSYHWPGNIRELENMIERSVLLTRDDMINHMGLPIQQEQSIKLHAAPVITTMSEGERAHIMAALKQCNGKVWGEGGAAALLDLPPTTLNSKMKKLGIRKDFGA